MRHKRSIYLEILECLLPYARNVQTWSRWRRLMHGDLYPELELVHNIPPLLKRRKMGRSDIHWLNTQARNYTETCKHGERPSSERLRGLFRELIALVPDDLRSELTWAGPDAERP